MLEFSAVLHLAALKHFSILRLAVQLLDFINYFVCCSIAVGFYILLRAADRFAANYNKFPGQLDGYMLIYHNEVLLLPWWRKYFHN